MDRKDNLIVEKRGRLFGLDLLRAAAVTGVVISHGFNFIPAAGRVIFEKFLFMPAYFGVELFFVLSGFLIGGILLKGTHTENLVSLRQFWIRRWFRTLPNYYFVLLLSLCLALILRETAQLHWRDLLDLFFLQNLAWAHSEFFGRAWSLAIEEWFYLLFPLAVLLLRKWRLPLTAAFIVAAILFILGPTLARVLALKLRPELFWAAHYWKIVIFRLDALMFGVLGAYLQPAFPKFWERWRYGLLLVSLLILWVVLACFEGWIPLSKFLFCVVVCPLTSLGFAFCLPFFSHWKRGGESCGGRLITKVALYSYSIYLLHALVYEGLERLEYLWPPGTAIRYGLILLLLVLSYYVSKANYHWFEKPMMDLRERFPR